MKSRALAWLTVMTLSLAACTGQNGGTLRTLGTIALGADLPLSGGDGPDGTSARNAIDLAVKQAGRVCGAVRHQDVCFDLRSITYDDVLKGVHDPAQGAKNVELLAGDPNVAGLIGPLYDSVAKSELPVANAAHLAMISPAVTDECLTQEPPDGHCRGEAGRLRPRGPNNFFRVVTTQLAEGAAGADLAFKTLGKRRAFVINDQTPFGLGIATTFVDRFVADGGTIVDPSDLGGFDPATSPSFGSRVQRAVALAADVVYFAGADIYAAASLRREMVAQMPQVPLIGSDRLANDQFAKSAGATARGSYYTVVGPHPASLRPAQGFIRDYQKRYGQTVGTYSVQAFDAANLLIAAIGRAIDDAGGQRPSRSQVVTAVSRTTAYSGAMGVM
ncbi:MAG: branched-chain amino acid transport system substrate-binding protein, partial [Chloroflexota bacterium]|nr:branched-chain amino acid transport system substrate-binding protein [Chloroflexota bacterium]